MQPAKIAPNRAAVAISEPVLPASTSRWWSTGFWPFFGPTDSEIWPLTRRSKVSAWIRTASGPSSDSSVEARANRKSPDRMASELSQRWFAEATPRRSAASSMTSSWYSVARWVSSTTTAASTMPARAGSPNCAASSTSSGRVRLPPACARCEVISLM